MDFSESTKIVYSRIQEIEPEYVSKIVGYLLLQDDGEREMIRLAFSPDNVIHSLINKAKSDLHLNKRLPVSDIPLKFTPSSPRGVPWVPGPYCDSPLIGDQMQFLNFDDRLEFVNSVSPDSPNNYVYREPALGPRTSRRSPSLPDFPVKVCHYFNKGFCKHGNNCRYLHCLPMPESFSNNIVNEDHASPGSLEKLELELTELLKSKHGMPVSIASLPMMYYEKYGKTLQAEGYLTESQRHGKAGYSLTKLLSRLKSRILLIDRPHGQHSVILAEDVLKDLDHSGKRDDTGEVAGGSRQIYLTFPAESSFTEQDVSIYFSKFGPVHDVRIPCQQKRMFGFVTFVFAETVMQILARGNPHFVCGARVLVKPYREKSRLVDRKFMEKMQRQMFLNRHFVDGDSELNSTFNSGLLKQQFMEEQALELERMRLLYFHVSTKNP